MFNERDTIAQIVSVVKAVPVDKEIIIVDDCSTDGTREKLAALTGVKVLYHDRNQGKGAAFRTGLHAATGDVVIIQDADLEYDPFQYPQLLAPFAEPEVQAVYGSRFRGKGEFLLASRIANVVITGFARLLWGGHLTDIETCYKAVRRPLLMELNLRARGFEIDPEITAQLRNRRARMVEVPISYRARKVTEGKKIGVSDGFKAIHPLLRGRFGDPNRMKR